mgnify:CR=1 FL=1
MKNMIKIKVRVKLIHPDAKMPFYGSEEAAGFDLYSVEDVTIMAGETKIIKTGVSLEIQEGYCFQVWDRSGLGAKGIHRFAGLGDSDYRGEYKIVLHNSTQKDYEIKKGDRIAQIVPVPIVRADFEQTEKLNETSRGEGGFHSTGQ